MPEKEVEAQFQEAVASTLRAMAGGTEHDIVFVGDNTFLNNDKINVSYNLQHIFVFSPDNCDRIYDLVTL